MVGVAYEASGFLVFFFFYKALSGHASRTAD